LGGFDGRQCVAEVAAAGGTNCPRGVSAVAAPCGADGLLARATGAAGAVLDAAAPAAVLVLPEVGGLPRAEGEGLEAVVDNDDWVPWAGEEAGVRDVPPAASPALALADDAGRGRVDEPAVALPAARAFSAARILTLWDVAGALPPIDDSAAVAAIAARVAAGWSAGSGAGSSSGPGLLWWVGRGEPMGTQPGGRTTPPESLSPGRRRSACCTAYCADVGAIRGAARSGASAPSRGARAAPVSLGVGATPEMNVDISKCASIDLSARMRNSANRCATVERRSRVAWGSTARTVSVVIRVPSLAPAATSNALSTITRSGHGESRVDCRGHQWIHSRRHRVHNSAATAALRLVSAICTRVSRSVVVSTMRFITSLASSVEM